MKKALVVLSIFFGFYQIKAQDVQFSQAINNPQYINPAKTGIGEDLNSLSISYKDQWRSIPVPYTTLFASYERSLRNTSFGTNRDGRICII